MEPALEDHDARLDDLGEEDAGRDNTTTRMVKDVYDSFIDPASWPEEEERQRLATVFGFDGAARTEVSWARKGTHARPGPREAKAPPS